MKCKGCYKAVQEGYCLSCRKKLFDNPKIPAILSFDAPASVNMESFQEHTKHLSISGVQLKYSLSIKDRRLALCENGAQYILKPIPPSKHLVLPEDVPENEHLTMHIAEKLFGINTATNALIQFKDGAYAYLTKRFDVKPDSSKFLQEDFAQLTSRTKDTHGEHFKYDGTYEEIGLLIKRFVAAAQPAIERFFQIILFNYFISNGDAHLKNFSLIRNDNGEYQLAPAYDLINTVIHTPIESDTALDLYKGDIDSEFYSSYGYYGRENFMELARRLEVIEKRAIRMIDVFAAKHGQLARYVEQSFLSEEAKEKYLITVRQKLTRIQ